MVGSLLLRGMLAGVLAGLLAVMFGALIGEPSIERAIAYESAAAQAAGEPPEPAIVSREVQRGAGLLTAGAVYGAALGGVFGLAFAFAYGRIGGTDPRIVSAFLAGAGFVAIALVPALKYPANPPAIGAAETIGARTALYFIMALGSLLAMIIVAMIGQWLADRVGDWNAGFACAALFVAAVGAAAFLLPPVDEVPTEFPADLLRRFRLASLGVQAVLWAALGLSFGAMTPSAHYGAAARG
ncbi:CbtA family protein [Methylocapsa polymorpha]|uniref:CbtA family protein n=1 Tax=Methylocapsa polymorpha TaxID=3080828 RepID=A0ABZ0HNU9_9HYPH|nr:CbtA family protein [Methylocapsa sp. RX1]